MKYIWIGLAGVVGANLRYGISLWTDNMMIFHTFPLATFIANMIGAFCIGAFSAYFAFGVNRVWFISIRTGLIGSFTTFSAFSMEVVSLIESGHLFLAFLYAISSFVLSLLFVFIGMRLFSQREVA